MTRLQSVLVLTLGVLVAMVFGRIAWSVVGPLVIAVPALAHSVPGWVWWAALGAFWWVPCAFGAHGCRRSTCSTSAA